MKETKILRLIIMVVLLIIDAALLAVSAFFSAGLQIAVYVCTGLIAVVLGLLLLLRQSDQTEVDTVSDMNADFNDIVGVFTVSVSEKYHVLYCNDTFAKLCGYKTAAELYVKKPSLADIILSESLASMQSAVVEAIAADRKSVERGVEIVLPDGKTRKMFLWGRISKKRSTRLIDGCIADFSNYTKLNNDLESLNDTLSAATSMLSSMVFLVNIPERSLLNLSSAKFSGEFFEYVPDFPNTLAKYDSIHKDDKDALLSAVNLLLAGKKECDMILRFYSSSGKLHYMHLKSKTVFGHNHEPVRAVAILEDVTEHTLREEQLLARAEIDPLSKIYNRQTTVELISEALISGSGAFLFLDLDDFKSYNDTCGHQKGDEKIAQIAAAMRHSVRKNDIVGRLAGDEFTVFIKDLTDEKEICVIAEKISANINALNAKNDSIPITVSIGIAVSPAHGNTFEALYNKADKALYMSKNTGRNSITVYKA